MEKKVNKKKLLEFFRGNAFGLMFTGITVLGALLADANIAMHISELIDSLSTDGTLAIFCGVPLAIIGLGAGIQIRIDTICANKLEKINEETVDLVESKEIVEYLDKIKSMSYTNTESKNNNLDMTSKIDLFVSSSREAGIIKEELFDEWQTYLNNTITDDASIGFIRELFDKLILLNNVPSIELALDELQSNGEIIDLLIHFGKRGKELAIILGRPLNEMKRVRNSENK